jgi:hypothetical protein
MKLYCADYIAKQPREGIKSEVTRRFNLLGQLKFPGYFPVNDFWGQKINRAVDVAWLLSECMFVFKVAINFLMLLTL